MKKPAFLAILVILALTLSVPAFAIEESSTHRVTSSANGYLIISDPVTGEQWSWNLPVSDIVAVHANSLSTSAESPCSAEVNIDISEYLLQTMANSLETEKVLHDSITLTVGLEYSVDSARRTVSIYRAYGSAPRNGLYYAMDKAFYYSNPTVFDPIEKHPTASSWSYVTNSAPGDYYSELPPYALLDCRITVEGMEHTYRDVSVICRLDWL